MKKHASAAAPAMSSLRAVPFLKTIAGPGMIVLTPRQREELAQIALRLRLPGRRVIYREDAPADAVFAVAEGTVECYRELPSGKRAVCAFLFAHDLFGLAEHGRYLNCAEAVTPVTLYRLSLNQLTLLLKQDADLQFQSLSKVTHELRESQRRSIVMARRDAAGRLAMFLALMAERSDRWSLAERKIPLPMSRSDIAAFLGLTLETVSRAAAELESRNLVAFEGRHLARVLDPARLAKLAAAV